MQSLNWDDLRYVLAVVRTGTIAAAARHLDVDGTTVSRRIRAVERSLAVELFIRTASGHLRPTTAGKAVSDHAERIEAEMMALGDTLNQTTGRLIGTVRVTAVPVVANHIIVPQLPEFLARYPDVTVDLIAESRDLNLTEREADLALRLASPRRGGLRVKARKIGVLAYGLYAARGRSDAAAQSWIIYDDLRSYLPQARWFEAARKRATLPPGPLRVADATTAIEAAAHGLGQAVLPIEAAARDPRLSRIGAPELPPLPEREAWLLSQADQKSPAVLAMHAWLASLKWRR